ncbi:hypothetical protein DV515_00012418, partial [Chloebia gouldiae]
GWRRFCGAGRAAPRWPTCWRGCRTWNATTGTCILLGVSGQRWGGSFVLLVLNRHEGTWRLNCSCSALAWTAWQTWKPSRSPGRGFWSVTRTTLFKIPS